MLRKNWADTEYALSKSIWILGFFYLHIIWITIVLISVFESNSSLIKIIAYFFSTKNYPSGPKIASSPYIIYVFI